jgi:dihydroorotate dehydrogenase
MNTRIRALRIPKYINHRSFFTFRSTVPRPRSPLRTTLYATTFLVSASLFAVYYFDARSALHRSFVTPLLRQLDPETSHRFALNILKSGLAPRDPLPDDARLKARVRFGCRNSRFTFTPPQIWELEISNPVGLAAGFDKDGEAIDGAPIPSLNVSSEY